MPPMEVEFEVLLMRLHSSYCLIDGVRTRMCLRERGTVTVYVSTNQLPVDDDTRKA